MLLYLITKGYSFYTDDLILVERENAQLKYFPRPLHVRENTMDMFSDFFRAMNIQSHKLNVDSYFVELPHTKTESIVPKVIIDVEYNTFENSFAEKLGFNKVLRITKNMKGTNISNWQNNMRVFNNVGYFVLKYSDFAFIDKLIVDKIGGIS